MGKYVYDGVKAMVRAYESSHRQYGVDPYANHPLSKGTDDRITAEYIGRLKALFLDACRKLDTMAHECRELAACVEEYESEE